MTPAELFEHAVLINLDSRTDRLKLESRILADAGIPFERWPARPLANEIPQSMLKIWKSTRNNPHRHRGGAGTIAATLTHRSIMEHALASGWGSVCVFEDDMFVPPDILQRLEVSVSELPDTWQLLALGVMFNAQPCVYSQHLWGNFTGWGTHAYVARPKAMLALCKAWETCATMSGDHLWMPVTRSLPGVYAVRPLLALQLASDTETGLTRNNGALDFRGCMINRAFSWMGTPDYSAELQKNPPERFIPDDVRR